MTRTITIVMYHYVRSLKDSRYPRIRGLDLSQFEYQLDFLASRFTIVDHASLVAAVRGTDELPADAALLTFDDGFVDHFDNVVPRLLDRDVRGLFFPSGDAVMNHRLLDAHKIHFVLAAVDDVARMMPLIRAFIDREHASLPSFAELWAQLAAPSRWDPPALAFVKRLLQWGLPKELRLRLLDELFRAFVGRDEAEFACELYLNPQQLRAMLDAGMYIGSHSWSHPWLNKLPSDAQAVEVEKSLAFLETIGAPVDDWIMCYPYGGWDDQLLDVLRSSNCAAGLTTQVGVADLSIEPLTLSRFDTNDFPKS